MLRSVRYDIKWKQWLSAYDGVEYHPDHFKIQDNLFARGIPEVVNAHSAIKIVLENEINHA